MRKILLFTGMLVSCLTLSGCDVSQMSTLADLSKPYTGFYECESILYGDDDMTDRFEYIRLELSYGGEFELSYRSKEGNEGSYGGTYEADTEAEEITLQMQYGFVSKSFTFPMKSGSIFVDLPLHGKLLHAQFTTP